jgi:hypothetical protein
MWFCQGGFGVGLFYRRHGCGRLIVSMLVVLATPWHRLWAMRVIVSYADHGLLGCMQGRLGRHVLLGGRWRHGSLLVCN